MNHMRIETRTDETKYYCQATVATLIHTLGLKLLFFWLQPKYYQNEAFDWE